MPLQIFENWAKEVHAGSIALTEDKILKSYQRDRSKFEQSTHAYLGMTTFTWGAKKRAVCYRSELANSGDLVIEIMPRETGPNGKQIQLPVQAAREFFEFKCSKVITLTEKGCQSARSRKMRLFENDTIRLVINELEYRDRPCLILFHRTGSDRYQFEIIPESIFPTRYRELLALCDRQTRSGSRRWGIIENAL